MATVSGEGVLSSDNDVTSIPSFVAKEQYEVVDGRYVETRPLGAYEVDIASFLMIALGSHARLGKLGRVVSEMLFVLNALTGLQRRPDLAVVSAARWPIDHPAPRSAAWDVIPDLAVEVVSPSNSAGEITARVGEYFDAGVRLVWVVYPIERLVYVHESPASIRVLTHRDTLDGGTVLPEFRLDLNELFLPVTESD